MRRISIACILTGLLLAGLPLFSAVTYPIVGTGQTKCYNNAAEIAAPAPGAAFFGQDAQRPGRPPAYTDNGDGTITDMNTGLTWVKARGAKMTWDAAVAGAATCNVGGYGDWRMPTIKELYSLINFTGKSAATAATSTPYLDTKYFEFVYGNTAIGERVIDCQDWSATQYVSTTMNGDATIFGVNFADGRIKGYPKYQPGSNGTVGYTLFVRYVRGNPKYGQNAFMDNGDGTVSDGATGLMWAKTDSGAGMNWQDALAWVQTQNAQNYLGHNDWRLPNAKELQSLVDYTRSPATSNTPAIDPIFATTAITNEGGKSDYPYVWTSTTHLDNMGAVYLSFGRALGWMQMPPNSGNYQLLDVHGAGAQRSDPKSGSASSYPYGLGPQGDVIRIANYVRLVRDLPQLPPPLTDFTFAPAKPLVGQTVSFTDTSAGSPTSWQWDFGDGATDTTQNPTHVYAVAGAYTVTLTTGNAGGNQPRQHQVVVAALTYQPDLLIKGLNDADFKGAHVYNDPAVQTSSAPMPPVAVYHLLLNSDGNGPDNVKLTGPAGENGWIVKYFDERNAAGDITAEVTGAGWTTDIGSLLPVPVRVEVAAAPEVKGNAVYSATVSAVSTNDPTKSDFVVAVTTKLPLQNVALLGAPMSPVLVNTPVQFTAVPLGGGPAEFKFRTGTVVNGVTTWDAMPANYTPNPVFCWTPAAEGAYAFMVYAREQGTTPVKWSAPLIYTVKPPLSLLSLTVTPPSPQPWDQPLTLSVTPAGGAKPEYRFKACYRDANNVLQWLMLRDYAPTPTWTGKLPQDAARTYTLYAYAREQGTAVPYLLYAPGVNFTTKPPLSALTMTVTPPSPALIGTTLTVKSIATGGAQLEYQFKATYTDATGALVKLLLQDYGGNNTWTGKLPADAPRTYLLYVYAREKGTPIAYLKSVYQAFTIRPPLAALAMSVTPPSPQKVGVPLTVKALPTGGCKLEFAFKATYTDATGALVKLTLQDYSPSDTWTGPLPQDAPRVYTLYVYAREQGTAVLYLKSVTQNYAMK